MARQLNNSVSISTSPQSTQSAQIETPQEETTMTSTTVNFAQDISILPLTDEGIGEEGIIEMRMTAKRVDMSRAKKDNKQMFFIDGKGSVKDGSRGLFASFRPFPWQQDENKEIMRDADGNAMTRNLWCKSVSKIGTDLSLKEAETLALLKANPLLLQPEGAATLALLGDRISITPQVLQALNSNGLVYEDYNLKRVLSKATDGELAERIKLSFDIPKRYYSLMQKLQRLVNTKAIGSKGNNYSLVIRFHIGKLEASAKGLEDDLNYDTQSLTVYIKEITFMGIVEGYSRPNDGKSRVLDTMAAHREELAQAKLAAQDVKSPFLAKAEINNMVSRIRDRVNNTGTGKKAHHQMRDELKAAAREGNIDKMNEAIECLQALADRGTNPHVTSVYVNTVVAEANLLIPVLSVVEEAQLSIPVATETEVINSIEEVKQVASEQVEEVEEDDSEIEEVSDEELDLLMAYQN